MFSIVTEGCLSVKGKLGGRIPSIHHALDKTLELKRTQELSTPTASSETSAAMSSTLSGEAMSACITVCCV